MKETPVDLHRLEIFCRLVELKSFTRAAEAVYLSQPTVSEHIRSLEEMLGEKLVDRLGREVVATPAGQLLYKYARRLLRLQEEAVQALRQFSGRVAGTLLIGASTIPGTYVLPRLVGMFKELHPEIQMVLGIANSRQVANEVLAGEVEVGVVGASWNDPSLEWQEVFADELVLAVPPGHPWAGRAIAASELGDAHFLMRERFSGTRKVMLDYLGEQNVTLADLKVVAELGSSEAVRQSIKARIGVGILSRQAVAEDVQHGSLAIVKIKELTMRRPFYLVKRRNRVLSPVCSVFLDFLQDEEGRFTLPAA